MVCNALDVVASCETNRDMHTMYKTAQFKRRLRFVMWVGKVQLVSPPLSTIGADIELGIAEHAL